MVRSWCLQCCEVTARHSCASGDAISSHVLSYMANHLTVQMWHLMVPCVSIRLCRRNTWQCRCGSWWCRLSTWCCRCSTGTRRSRDVAHDSLVAAPDGADVAHDGANMTAHMPSGQTRSIETTIPMLQFCGDKLRTGITQRQTIFSTIIDKQWVSVSLAIQMDITVSTNDYSITTTKTTTTATLRLC